MPDERLTGLEKDVAVLKNEVAELKKYREESDRRVWAVTLLTIGSLLTLIGNLLLFAFRGK